MPKPKRRKNFLGFGKGNLFSSSTTYHIDRSGGSPSKSSAKVSKGIQSLGKHHAVRKGDGWVTSVDRDSIFDTKKEAEDFARDWERRRYNPKGRGMKRKRNVSVGLPKNQFVNAQVRMSGSKVQIKADEKVLGKAGFKAGAGLSGVSVSGGAKLNPKRKNGAKRQATIRKAVVTAKRVMAQGIGYVPRRMILGGMTRTRAKSILAKYDN